MLIKQETILRLKAAMTSQRKRFCPSEGQETVVCAEWADLSSPTVFTESRGLNVRICYGTDLIRYLMRKKIALMTMTPAEMEDFAREMMEDFRGNTRLLKAIEEGMNRNAGPRERVSLTD